MFLFQVRELAYLRMDHHPDHHCKLRRHGSRRQTSGRGQNDSINKNGKKERSTFKLKLK
jgi:hypothetical protein